MDPITMAITGALANLGTSVIKDAYTALKAALQAKYGVDSKLVEAVGELEDNTDSKARQAVVQEEVEKTNAAQDPEIVKLVEALTAALEKSGQSGGTTTNISQTAGDDATQIGTVGGDVNIKK